MAPRSAYLLIPILKDIYRVVLGEPDVLTTPSSELARSMHSAVSVVRNNGYAMFKSLSEADLNLFEQYRIAVAKRIEQMATNAVLPEITGDTDDAREQIQDTMMALGTISKCLEVIQKAYEEYQHFEEVKIQPNTYYPWALQSILPFFRELRWEIGSGNFHTSKQQKIHDIIQTFLTDKKLDDDAYVEEFDCIADGNIDGFLKQLHELVIQDADLQRSSNAVWQKGVGYCRQTVSAMPETLVQQILEKHKDTAFAEYIRAIREGDRKNEEKYG